MAIYSMGSSRYSVKYKYQPVLLKVRNSGLVVFCLSFFEKEAGFHKVQKTFILNEIHASKHLVCVGLMLNPLASLN